MDNRARQHWEQVADRCFERAYQKALLSVKLHLSSESLSQSFAAARRLNPSL